ncbi:ATP-dependent zinc protease [Pseudomonadota bacterium]
MNNTIIRILCIFLCTQTSGAMADTANLKILGWVENAFLPGPGLEVKAKLDTGAETSSLDARVIKKFRKGGKRWVRFALVDRDSGKEYILVQERVRTIGVVQHDGSRQTRPVVQLQICIGGQTLNTEVSLIDRSEFNYPLLLGRSALGSFALVDPSGEFLGESGCDTDSKQGNEP